MESYIEGIIQNVLCKMVQSFSDMKTPSRDFNTGKHRWLNVNTM